MDHGIFRLAALLFACAFYAAVLAWRFRGVLADSARGLLGGWLALTPLGRLAAAVFASAAIVYAATKGQTNGPDGASAPRRILRSSPAALPPSAGLVAVPETAASVAGLFPACTNAVTSVCATGILPAQTSVFLRAHCPADLLSASSGVEIYATPALAADGWSCLGTAAVSGGGWVFELPYALLPGGRPPAMFFTLAPAADADGDGLSDAYERLVTRSDPGLADTDGDGLPDGEEVRLGADPNSADTDCDGLPDAAEVGSVTRLPPSESRWAPMAGPARIWSSTSYGGSGGFVVSLPYPYVANGVTYTQVRVCTDGVIYLLNPERPNSSYRDEFIRPPALGIDRLCESHVAVAAFCADLYRDAVYWGSAGYVGWTSVDNAPASVIDIYDVGFASDRGAERPSHFSYQLVLPSEEENVLYLTYWMSDWTEDVLAHDPTVGVQVPMLAPLGADETYYNLTWSLPASVQTGGACTLRFAIGRGTDPASADTDGDGFSDCEEAIRFRTDPNAADADADGDGLPDAYERRFGTDPGLADTDCDGLSDREELELGTDPRQPDTDGDGLNDGWEAKYDGQLVYPDGMDEDEAAEWGMDGYPVHLDPAADNWTDCFLNNDPDADPDEDGLSNAEECALGSNPCRRDTDGDGTDDGTEAAQGSDPTDPTDGGAPGNRVRVPFRFGDHSDSHSEKYRLTVTPVSGDGTRPSSFAWLNERYGQCETKDAFLKPGWRYEVRLAHAGTKPGETADYDYTLRTEGALPANVIVDDPGGLFGVDETSTSFAGAGKVATLYVLAPPQLTAPQVVGLNSDDDDGNGRADWEDERNVEGEDDLVEIRVWASEPAGVQGTVTVTPYMSLLSGTLWKDREKSVRVEAPDILPIPSSGIVDQTYYLEGSCSSSVYRGEQLEVKVACGSVTLTTNHAFTVVGRIAEPITSERFGGQIANPCCAVAGAPVPLKIDVLPRDFPEAEIRWRVVSGDGSFQEGCTGRTVKFTTTGSEDALSTVQVDVGDCPGSAPQLTVRTTKLHEVLIFPCVVEREGEEPPITASTLATWLDEVNVIYRQVGLRFSLGAPITNIVNDAWARNGLVNESAGAQIRNVLSCTGGIEVYFIPGSGLESENPGAHTSHGIIVRSSAGARTLAHEIGHACGWADIYIKKNSNTPIPEELYGKVSRGWASDDWSGGGGVGGFYETDLRQCELITRLLMYGVEHDAKADIPSGFVYGLPKSGGLGNVNVGRNGFFTPSPRSL